MAKFKRTNKIKVTNINKNDETASQSSNRSEELYTEEAESFTQTESAPDALDANESSQSSAFDLDDFSKALLEKKTEMKLYGTEPKETAAQTTMTYEERKEAEHSMHSALDELRRSRGQVPIDQEEEDYHWNKTLKFDDRFGDQEDFTTASLFGAKNQNVEDLEAESAYENTEKPAKELHIEQFEQRPDEQQAAPDKKGFWASMNKSPEAKAAEAEKKAEKKAARQKAEHEPDQDVTEKAPVKKKKVKRKVIWILVGIVSVILLLFGGYAYKVMVYDPANTISAQQQEDFNKLRDYAEGFDKALEEEKLELLDLQDKYNALTEKQKEELDKIFKNFTGSTVTELIARLSEGKTITEESNPDYIALLDFANTYGSKSEAQQNSLTQYLDTYNRLSEDLKNNINQIMIQQSGSDFMAQYNLILERTGTAPAPAEEQNAQAEAPAETQQQPQISAEHQAQINALQTEINQLQTDRDNYYNFLVSEGLPTYSDSTLAAYDNEIAYRQSLVNSLSGQ